MSAILSASMSLNELTWEFGSNPSPWCHFELRHILHLGDHGVRLSRVFGGYENMMILRLQYIWAQGISDCEIISI